MYRIAQAPLSISNQSMPILGRVDVLVCGGGVAGIAAASVHARQQVRARERFDPRLRERSSLPKTPLEQHSAAGVTLGANPRLAWRLR